MRQSIKTKYIGPTNYRGSRVKATASSGLTLTLGWDDVLDSNENHAAAAVALCRKLGWTGRLAVGGAERGSGNVYVFVDTDAFTVK